MGRQRQSQRQVDTASWDDVESSYFFDNVVPLVPNRKTFKPLTPNHHRVIHHIRNSPITIINGPAGSLKTFLSLQTLIQLIDDGAYGKIVYIRQRIQRPHEPELGSLPGDKSEKLHKLLAPILDNLEAILSPYAVDEFIKTKIECSDIESLRGRSPLRSCLFCDEAQNCDLTALETIMTRRTECSKLVLAGDFKGQRDILDREFDAFELVCNEFESKFPIIHLTKNDILRSETNKDVITGFERIKERLQLIGV